MFRQAIELERREAKKKDDEDNKSRRSIRQGTLKVQGKMMGQEQE